jgi:MoaA/NifB/PqqE/SkfB family radical SAM enzyme
VQPRLLRLRQDPAPRARAAPADAVEQAIGAIEECGAPMVSIAGGEPLIHPEIDVIAAELIKRKKFVYLCTNALLMEKKLDLFKPSPYFAWAVHIDGLRERHDAGRARGRLRQGGRGDQGGQGAGFRVTTNTTFFTTTRPRRCARCSTSSTTSSRSTR